MRLQARLDARDRLRELEKSLSQNIYERGVDDAGFGRIRSKGDTALFGGNSTQKMKDRLRHRYAQMRYEVLTEWKTPAAGGPGKVQLSTSQRLSDQRARQHISRELGHERLKVTSIYLGT